MRYPGRSYANGESPLEGVTNPCVVALCGRSWLLPSRHDSCFCRVTVILLASPAPNKRKAAPSNAASNNSAGAGSRAVEYARHEARLGCLVGSFQRCQGTGTADMKGGVPEPRGDEPAEVERGGEPVTCLLGFRGLALV